MATYRTFRVGNGGRLLLGEQFDAEDDAAAIERAAAEPFEGQARELWERGRLVGRFSKMGVFTPGG